jgi:putative ABC transport system ATP-binding protein
MTTLIVALVRHFTQGRREAVDKTAPTNKMRCAQVPSPPMTSPFIAINDLSLELTWGTLPVKVLSGITLSAAPGEVIAISGAPGAGKTSLLMTLAGLQRATSGEIVIAGQSLSTLGKDGLALMRRRTLGFVFANFNLIPSLTALENVALPLEIASPPGPYAVARDEARYLLGAVGLDQRLDHLPKMLSGGEQQRVAVARSLITGPALLLADEPTGNLDGQTAQRVTDLLFARARQFGTTMLIVTHDQALVARADRLVRLDRGRLSAAEAVTA